jgi:hypothetical protein
MIRRKFSAALLLILGLLLAGAASASIIDNAYQMTQIVSPQPNSGSFIISSMKVVDRNGDLQALPGTMPANKVFILTKVTVNFTATDTSLTNKVTLNVGDYYRMGFVLSGGFCAGSDGIVPGIPIADLSDFVYLNKNEDPTKLPIPGKLNLRLIGYLADIN